MLRQLPDQLPQGVPRIAAGAMRALSHDQAQAGSRRTVLFASVIGAVALAAIGVIALLPADKTGPTAAPGEITGSTSDAATQLGPSGLPLPRFVSLKANKVNVRKGPSSEHPVAWIYQRKGFPVEIIAESDNWRKIRDVDGSEGWILQSMLSGKRTAVAAAWMGEKPVYLNAAATPASGALARLTPGALADVDSCDGEWCYLTATDYEGYARQTDLWGVYPGERVD